MSAIQIKNVPTDLHRALKVRAAREGITLSELISRELPRLVEEDWRLDWDAWRAGVKARGEPVDLPPGTVAAIIREGREEREQRFQQRWDR